jgi:hypothetical protein
MNTQVQRRSFLNWLSERSFIWWFIMTTILCYFIWHPIDMIPSLTSIVIGDSVSLPMKILMCAFTLVLLWLVLQATLDSIGVIGIAIIVVLLATIMWVLVDAGWMDLRNPTIWQWITQPIVGLILAFGIYWPRLRFSATAVRNTSDVDDEDQ